MATKFSVMFSGRVSAGQTPEAVRARLAALFHVEAARLDGLFRGGPVALKRGLDESTGRKWLAVLEKNGALCWLEQERGNTTPAEKTTASHPPSPAQTSVSGESSAQVATQTAIRQGSKPEVESAAVHPGARAPVESPIARFVKCPKCGRLAASIEDELMNGGECPSCGLLTEKYAKTCAEAVEATQPASPPLEKEHNSWLRFWQRADWPAYSRGSLLLSLVSISLPGLLYDCSLYDGWSSVVGLAVSGLLAGLIVPAAAVIGFFCWSLYRENRRFFVMACLCSLGSAALFALLGFCLDRVFRVSARLAGAVELGRWLTAQRSVLVALAPFPVVILCAVLIRFPAERRLTTFLDGEEYAAKVEGAKALAGPDFPSGARHLKYEYFKFVYVNPSREKQPDFDKTLKRLLPDYQAGGRQVSHNAEVDALVLNAARFAEELNKEGLISRSTLSALSRVTQEVTLRRQPSS